MSRTGGRDSSEGTPSPLFATTRWSLVLAAGEGDSERSREALGELFRSYGYALFAYLRRSGSDHEEAADLVQELFLTLLRRGDLARADPHRGRFRAYLLTALKHQRTNLRASESAEKRGGGARPLSLDWPSAEGRYQKEPAARDSPEAAFDAAWARAVLERALARLGADYRRNGRGEVLEALLPFLSEAPAGALTEAAQRLGTQVGALKVALHRLRARYGEALRREVLDTLTDPGDLENELGALLVALGGPPARTVENSPEQL